MKVSCIARLFNPLIRAFGAHIHFPFSIFNYKIGPDPSSFSLVMDLITTV